MRTLTSTAASGALPREGSPASLLIRRAAMLLVATLLSVGAYLSTDSPQIREVIPLFSAAIVLQFVPLFFVKHPDPFTPACIVAYPIGFGLLATMAYCMVNGSVEIGMLPHVSGQRKQELVEVVLWSYIVATACYLAGYYAPLGVRFKTWFPKVTGLEWRRGRLAFACAVCLAAFIPAYAYFQSRVGTSFTDLTQQAAGKAVWREDPNQTWLARGVLLGMVPLLFWISAALPRPRLRTALLVGGVTVCMMLLVSRLGQRGLSFNFALSAIIIIHYRYRRIPRWLVFCLIFAALALGNILGAWRREGLDPHFEAGPVEAQALRPAQVLAEHESDRQRLAALAVLFHYFPDRKDYLMGESWAAALVAPIPRWLWEDKVNYFRWRETTILWELVRVPTAVPIHGLFYANFSWIGMVLGMFGWGAVHRGLYEWLRENKADRSVVLIYSTLGIYLAPSLLALSMVMQWVLPCYLIVRFIGRRPRLRAAASGSPAAARLGALVVAHDRPR